MLFERYRDQYVKILYNEDAEMSPRWQKTVRGVVKDVDEAFIAIETDDGGDMTIHRDRVISIREIVNGANERNENPMREP